MAKWIRSMLYDIGATLNAVKSWRSNTEATERFRQVSKASQKRRAVLDLKRSPFERDSATDSHGIKGNTGQQHFRRALANVGRNTRNSRQWFLPQSGRLSKNSSARFFRTSGKTNRKEEPWMMTDEEVMEIIREKERVCKLQCGIVDRFEANKLSSNQPIEDRSFVARLPYDDDAIVFGVLDGHGGEACAHSVSQRLADYISMALLPEEVLLDPTSEFPLRAQHLLMVNTPNLYNYRKDLKCCESLTRFYSELRNPENRAQAQPMALGHSAPSEEHVSHARLALTKAFVALDRDICQEALLDAHGAVDKHYFDAAVSGACAVVAYLNGTELYIANAGDCRAVMGVENEDGTWTAVPLSNDHTSANPAEVQRVLREHPDETSTCIRYDRLLGRLAPFRAFGDVKFKWDRETQEQVWEYMGRSPSPDTHEYSTPPYLTAEPEVMSYQLQRSNKFLVLATDGLWDMLSNEEVVHYVQDHARVLRKKPIQHGAYEVSFQPKSSGCGFNNTASCLIREALGGDDHVALSMNLSIPYPDVRMYRDDMTVIVVHFDWDTLG